MRPVRILMLIVGVFAVVAGFGVAAAGAALTWAHTTQRDSAGYYTTDVERLQASGHAIVSDHVDLASDVSAADWARWADDLGTIRLTARAEDDAAVFVGIGPAADVQRYLANSDIHRLLGDHGPGWRQHVDGAVPAPPASQPFWAATASGPGSQQLTWSPERGDWMAVVMNADGSPGIEVAASAGIHTDLLLPVGLSLLGAGLLALALGVFLVVRSTRDGLDGAPAAPRPGTSAARTTASGSAGSERAGTPVVCGVYPVRVTGRFDQHLSRWLWLVKWLLAIPHLLVLAFLWIAFTVLTVFAGFAILFTGRYPRGAFEFCVGVLRWQWRVTYYALTLGTDRYPPFSLRSDPDYPADLHVPYPERLSRGLVLVKWWLLALPHYVIIGLFGALTWTITIDPGPDRGRIAVLGLTGLLALIAGVTLLVTGRYPLAIYEFILGMQRWTLRVLSYAALMRDEYPPFRLDSGGADPGDPGELPAEPPLPPSGPESTAMDGAPSATSGDPRAASSDRDRERDRAEDRLPAGAR